MKRRIIFPSILTLLLLLACSTAAFPGPEPTTIPSPSPQPTQTLSLSQSVQLTSIPFHEESQSPVYTIDAQIPQLTDSDALGVVEFNELMNSAVMDEVNNFKEQTITFATNPPITNGSFFDLKYSVIGQAANLWSMKFDITTYSDGAAHPGHYSMTINFDLERRVDLVMDELFLPDSNYLQELSEYCKAELATRDIAFDMFSEGADPLPENYALWNLSHDGLVITFNEYQVAPYAAGPQIVVIPFSELHGILKPQGPVAPFLP